MSVVLNYALDHTQLDRTQSDSRFRIPLVLFPVLISFAHLNFCWQMTKMMIVPVCWAEHLDFGVWTPAIWIPGALVSWHNGPLGILIMVAASVLAGFLSWTIIRAFALRTPINLGLSLRLFVVLVAWFGWLPLPATWSLPYQFAAWASRLL